MQVRESIARQNADRNVGRHFVPPFTSPPRSRFDRCAIRELWGEPDSRSAETIRRVLIVGDSPGVCAALTESLDHPRLRVRSTDSPARAFATLARESTDFIIAESQLRLASGIDFLEVVREEFPDVSRVLLTGDHDVALIREAVRRCDVGFFLPKPWDAGTIRELVERFLLAESLRDGAIEAGDAATEWKRIEANAEEDSPRGAARASSAIQGQPVNRSNERGEDSCR